MPAKKIENINLLGQEGLEITTTGRILAWVLTSFRIIIIFTEIIVMTAFFSRFWLDNQNAELDDQIRQKQEIIATSGNFENEFRNIQKRLEIFTDLTANTRVSSEILSTITSYIPSDTLLTSIRFGARQTDIDGISPGEKNIQQFMTNLASNDVFDSVLLNEISTSQENSSLLIFKLSLKHKEIAKK